MFFAARFRLSLSGRPYKDYSNVMLCKHFFIKKIQNFFLLIISMFIHVHM